MEAVGGPGPGTGGALGTWRLTLLGGARLAGPPGALALERKTAAVLAHLALEGETPKYKLAGWLWPDSPEHTARNNMRALLYRLRRTTGAQLVSGEDRIALAEDLETDAARLSALAFAGEHAAVLELPGELLAGLEYDDTPDFEEWLLGAREGLASLRRDAAGAEALRREREGDLAGALGFALKALELEPLSEEAHRAVMRLHYLQGDRGAALAAFECCREALRRELGAGPMPETLDLAREIERGGGVPGVAAARPASLPLSVLRPPALVGREREWALLEEAWKKGQFIAVSGEPGVGKSRLVLDFVASKAPRESVLYLQSRPGDAAVPYGTHARNYRQLLAQFQPELPPWVVRELARIVPELGESPGPISSEGEKLRFYQAKLAAMVGAVGNGMSVIVSDDVQFTDPASVEASAYMMGSLSAGGPVRAVYSYRRDELPPTMEAGFGAAVEAGIAVIVEIAPLPPEAVGDLLGSLELPGLEPAELAAAVSRYTGGNPLFVLETLRHLVETEQLARGWPGRLPPPGRVRPLIQRRLERLSEPARRLAWTAAVLGTELSLGRAARVLGADEFGLAAPWAELEAAQVLKGAAFSHDLVFEAALEAVPSATRSLLHRRAAEALEGDGGEPARIANHWLEGGEEGRAVPFLFEAAGRAHQSSRLTEAAVFLERAAEIRERQGDRAGTFEALRLLTRILTGQEVGPRVQRMAARLLALARSPAELAHAHGLRAFLSHRAGRTAEALDLARLAARHAAEAGEAFDLTALTPIHQVEAQVCIALGRNDEAAVALAAFQALAERLDRPDETAVALAERGRLAGALGNHHEAIRLYREGLGVLERWGQMRFGRAAFIASVATNEMALGRAREALQTLAGARAAFEEHPTSPDVLARFFQQEARALHATGAFGAALERLADIPAHDPLATLANRVRPARAAVLEALGRSEEARGELTAAIKAPDLEPNARAAALVQLAALLARHGEDARPALAEAEAAVSSYGGPALLARLGLARALASPPETALALAEAALETAEPLELDGLMLEAHTRAADALLALGRVEEAVAHAERATVLLLTRASEHVGEAEVRLAHHWALVAANRPDAGQALEAALAWVLETAREQVPPEHREGFLWKNPVNRAVLEAAREAGLAVPPG